MAEFATVALPIVFDFVKQSSARRAAKANQTAAANQANFQIQQIRKTQEIEERRRRERLAQGLATQRARFGGQGVSAAGGSAAALLNGLSKSIDSESRDARTLAGFRIANINSQLASGRRRNLLEASSARNRLAFNLLEKSIPKFQSLIGKP